MKRILLVLIVLISLTAGCSNQNDANSNNNDQPGDEGGITMITAEDAKARIDSEEGIILVDVRTQEEYTQGHIENALLLPVDTIAENAQEVIPDKDSVYFVYCRSGNRSAAASAQLAEMGYKNIYDLGGMMDWPYETVTGE
ncbi:MAG: rhodanese-like domain-containing protein [Eubacteriaceae bacterium]|nr:rhodanese-like domain-containing protein [Eubacteriaceae bacterium]